MYKQFAFFRSDSRNLSIDLSAKKNLPGTEPEVHKQFSMTFIKILQDIHTEKRNTTSLACLSKFHKSLFKSSVNLSQPVIVKPVFKKKLNCSIVTRNLLKNLQLKCCWKEERYTNYMQLKMLKLFLKFEYKIEVSFDISPKMNCSLEFDRYRVVWLPSFKESFTWNSVCSSCLCSSSLLSKSGVRFEWVEST